jgi:hypothetical protein
MRAMHVPPFRVAMRRDGSDPTALSMPTSLPSHCNASPSVVHFTACSCAVALQCVRPNARVCALWRPSHCNASPSPASPPTFGNASPLLGPDALIDTRFPALALQCLTIGRPLYRLQPRRGIAMHQTLRPLPCPPAALALQCLTVGRPLYHLWLRSRVAVRQTRRPLLRPLVAYALQCLTVGHPLYRLQPRCDASDPTPASTPSGGPHIAMPHHRSSALLPAAMQPRCNASDLTPASPPGGPHIAKCHHRPLPRPHLAMPHHCLPADGPLPRLWRPSHCNALPSAVRFTTCACAAALQYVRPDTHFPTLRCCCPHPGTSSDSNNGSGGSTSRVAALTVLYSIDLVHLTLHIYRKTAVTCTVPDRLLLAWLAVLAWLAACFSFEVL